MWKTTFSLWINLHQQVFYYIIKLTLVYQAQYLFLKLNKFQQYAHNIILNKDDFLWVMNGKDNIFLLLILRTREGLMSFITNLRLSPTEVTPLKHAWAGLPMTWPINLLDRCTKQMAHNMDINSCSANSSISSHCLFNILFQRRIRMYQGNGLIHKYTVSLCNSSNSLREHKQQYKAVQTALHI